jgi:hypothetical protein
MRESKAGHTMQLITLVKLISLVYILSAVNGGVGEDIDRTPCKGRGQGEMIIT